MSELTVHEEISEMQRKLDKISEKFKDGNSNSPVQPVKALGINRLIDEIDKLMSISSTGMQFSFSRSIIVHLLQEDYIISNDVQDLINRVSPTRTP